MTRRQPKIRFWFEAIQLELPKEKNFLAGILAVGGRDRLSQEDSGSGVGGRAG